MAKENEQQLKNVKPQEVNSLVQGVMIGHLETDCENVFRVWKHWKKDIQFTKVCEDASFWRRVSVGMSYKTIPDVDDGFGDRTPACREYTLPREDSDSRIYATIPGQTIIGPVLQVHIIQYLGINGIEIQIPSTTTKIELLAG